MDLFSNFFFPTFPHSLEPASTCLQSHDVMLRPLPASHSQVNAVVVNNNLAVLPGDWKSGAITSPFYDIVPDESCVASAMRKIRLAEFIALDDVFMEVLGSNARLEKIQSFPADKHHVHEAPVYLPETNELLYSDTSEAGILHAINIDSREVRDLHLDPPLSNINGATYHRGQAFIATNGGPVRGIHRVNTTTGQTETILNNYRGRRFNSPNDLVFDSTSNLYFTDPTYGYDQGWPHVQAPELPNAIYKFDPRTKAITTLSSGIIGKPNGLAFSADEKTLYVADSSSTDNKFDSQRAVFAFDAIDHGMGLQTFGSPRLVYQVESGWPDGVRVTGSGLLMVGVAGGADVVDPRSGALLGKINTPDDIIFNLEPARGKGVWLLTGQKHIYKASIKEGPVVPAQVRSAGSMLKALREQLKI